jgi:hypothetical protein
VEKNEIKMRDPNETILDQFIQGLERELDLRNKIHISEQSQLETIGSILESYLKYFEDLKIKNIKHIKGLHPSVLLEFYKSTQIEEIVESVRKSLMELGIRFKQHKFPGSVVMFSCKNSTVPGLLDGRGYFLISFLSSFKSKGCSIKIECLRENQVIKVLDGKLESLSVVFWTGKSMNRTLLSPADPIEGEFIPDEDGILNVDLISSSGQNIKAKAEFSRSLNDGIILERITSVIRC